MNNNSPVVDPAGKPPILHILRVLTGAAGAQKWKASYHGNDLVKWPNIFLEL